jgi:hypothetical protein
MLRTTVSWLVLALSFTMAAVFISVSLFYGIGLAWESLFGEEPSGAIDRIFADVMGKVVLTLVIMSYVAIYIAPVLLTLPVVGPLIAHWTSPRRFLLLRTFNRGWPNQALRRIARRNVGPLGHAYTLSDADIKRPWTTKAPYLLGQFSLFSFRLRTIQTQEQVSRLERAINRTWLRNLNWCLSFNKLFPVVSTDAAWKSCVSRLIKASDAILIDVSELRQSVVWEIEECLAHGAAARLIFLLRSGSTLDKDLLEEILGTSVDQERVFAFDNGGVQDRAAFRAAVEDIVNKNVSQAESTLSPIWRRLSFIGTLGFSLGFFPLLPLMIYNDSGEDPWMPMWSPWNDRWPTFQEVANPEALAVYGFGTLTLLVLLVAVRTHPHLRLLVVIQVFLLILSAFGYFPSAIIIAWNYFD